VPRRLPTLDIAGVVASAAARSGSPDGPVDRATTAMLDATGKLLSRYGLHRWSLDDVAAGAGLGRATVYRRFAGRDVLVHATLTRDTHRFFDAITRAVGGAPTVEDKLVEGFVVGVRVARRSLLADLLRRDGPGVVELLTGAPVLAIARDALVDAYRRDRGGRPLVDPEAAGLVAEAVVRLALSFVLVPESVVDLDEEAARRVLRPLLAPWVAVAAGNRPGSPVRGRGREDGGPDRTGVPTGVKTPGRTGR
jgi:AcrR family transcriptional regulator